jgi:stage II sporulation protein E
VEYVKSNLASRSLPLQNQLLGDLAKYIIVFLSAMLLTNVSILGKLTPFCISVTAALPLNLSYISFIGNILGLIIYGNFTSSPSFVVGLCLVLAFKFIGSNFFTIKNQTTFNCVSSFFSTLISYLIFSNLTRISFFSVAISLFTATLSLASTFFFSKSIKGIMLKKMFSHFSTIEKTGFVILFGLILISACNVEIFTLNLGIVLGILAILIFMNKLGGVGGAISGIIVAISLTLFDKNLALLSGVLLVSGFLAGEFKPLGKIPQIAIFISTFSFGIIIIDVNIVSFSFMINILFSTFFFLTIKDSFLDKVVSVSSMNSTINSDAYQGISSKLNFASNTLYDLKASVVDVSKKMDEIDANDISSVYSKTADEICKKCGLNMYCWTTSYNDTMNVLNKCTSSLKSNTKIVKDDIPKFFQNKCSKIDEFISRININYQDFLLKKSTNRKISEARIIALNQFDGIANMLCEMSNELSLVSKFDDKAAIKIREVFSQIGIIPDEICCIVDKHYRMGIEVYLKCDAPSNLIDITSRLSSVLERDFDIPSYITLDNKTKLAFFEKANFEIDFGGAQMPYENYTLCGDSYDYFNNSKGFAHLILSDGMGSGGRAAIDSSMTCSIILKLLKAGFGFESAIKLLNCSMLAKSTEESLATIDISCIDLYSGHLQTLKVGTAPSFICRNGKVKQIKCSTLPIGILDDVEIDKYEIQLKCGDVLVMVSDGITDTGDEFVEAELEQSYRLPADELAQKICNQAKKRRIGGRSDDLTVMVAKIKKV